MTKPWLVVNADDLGVSESATLGVCRAHREGIVTSASIAVTTPAYAHAVANCVRACPELGIGLHFTLTSGAPVGTTGYPALLAGADGQFTWRFTSLFAARSRPDLLRQIEIELDAQLRKLRTDGIVPDHIDGERHVHLIPGILERVVDAARRHGIRFVRAGVDAGAQAFPVRRVPSLAVRGGFVKARLLSRLARRAQSFLGNGVYSADRVVSYFGSGQTHHVKRSALERSAGITELMVHPGVSRSPTPLALGNDELERYLASPDRDRELEFCIAAREWITPGALTNYTQLAAALT